MTVNFLLELNNIKFVIVKIFPKNFTFRKEYTLAR